MRVKRILFVSFILLFVSGCFSKTDHKVWNDEEVNEDVELTILVFQFGSDR